jgi:nitrous oxidase accessory protein NosD
MSPHEPQPSTVALEKLGRYQLQRKLGQGGMGAVYLAADARLDRDVAIKVLPPESVNDPDAVARFQREAKALAKLSHPGIVQAYDCEEDNGRHFLVMEYVEGTSLAAVLKEKGRTPPALAADYIYQAALALQHAHERGLIHRDLKPSNLLLTADGCVKLLDLGLARFLQDQIGDAAQTREGVGMGTPDYAAPEQFRDAHKADVRSDIYSLGCTLYHLIAGRVPFPTSSLSEKYQSHREKEPPPLQEVCPEVPGGLVLLVKRMMAKHPNDRFQTALEVAEALAPHVAGSSRSFARIETSSHWDGSQLTTTALPSRRWWLPWAVAGMAVAALLAVLAVSLPALLSHRAPNGEDAGKTTDQGPGETIPAEAEAKLPDDPNVLTVSQDPKDGGKYRTINAALEQAHPGNTIRVLDAKIYPEALSITQASRHAGITLEAPRRATLAPQTKIGLDIANGPGVRVRGFRLQSGPGTLSLIGVRHRSPGVVLEDLELLGNLGAQGISIQFLSGERTDAPVLVRGCVFRELLIGIRISGRSVAWKAVPCGRILVQNNAIKKCHIGVVAMGAVHDLYVVGNRIEGCTDSGVALVTAFKETRDILIANNTLFENRQGFYLLDDVRKTEWGERIALRNNLFLASKSDLMFLDTDDTKDQIKADGDGRALLKAWQIDHNGREVEPSNQGKGWIPGGTLDVIQPRLDGLSRNPDGPGFLRPAKDSPLGTEGAGKTDPSLPSYIGAVPPEGVAPWDWQRTWLAPPPGKLLTVSKDARDGGQFRSINEALAKAKPWTTIRVLDDALYPESLVLDDPAKQAGITLEATRGATLLLPPGSQRTVLIKAVPDVRINGFRFGRQADDTSGAAYLVVTASCPGTVLEHLHLEMKGRALGIILQNIEVSSPAAPVVVRGCTLNGGYNGIVVAGPGEGGGRGALCRSVALRDNRVSGLQGTGILLSGNVSDVHVTGNLVRNCGIAALEILKLLPSSDGILIANNSLLDSEIALRVFDSPPFMENVRGQVEVRNNLCFDASGADMAFIVLVAQAAVSSAERGRSLVDLWRFAQNWRDLSGSSGILPLAREDQKVEKLTLLSRDPNDPNFLRPASDSPLATGGAGQEGPWLPTYVGAVPPKGVEPWDWSVTWNARMRKPAPAPVQPEPSKQPPEQKP